MKTRARINSVYMGDVVTFETATRSVTGTVTSLVFSEDQGGYQHILIEMDGMTYMFGTGGHLGNTWTTEGGTEEWTRR